MRHVRQIQSALRKAGVYSLPEVALGAPASRFEIAVTRDALPSEAVGLLARLEIEGSEDGGATWIHLGGISVAGGVSIDKNGNPLAESTFAITFSDVKPATYLLRGTAALYQDITAGMRLTVS